MPRRGQQQIEASNNMKKKIEWKKYAKKVLNKYKKAELQIVARQNQLCDEGTMKDIKDRLYKKIDSDLNLNNDVNNGDMNRNNDDIVEENINRNDNPNSDNINFGGDNANRDDIGIADEDNLNRDDVNIADEDEADIVEELLNNLTDLPNATDATTQWTQTVDKFIRDRELRTKSIRTICYINGIDRTGSRAELIDRIYSKPGTRLNVLNIPNPVNNTNHHSSAPQNNVNVADTNHDQNDDDHAASTTALEDTQNTTEILIANMSEEEKTQRFIEWCGRNEEKMKKVLRHEIVHNIKESQRKLNDLINRTMHKYADDVKFAEDLDDTADLLNNIYELYRAVPRRKRSKYSGQATRLPDAEARRRQYNHEKDRMMDRVCLKLPQYIILRQYMILRRCIIH